MGSIIRIAKAEFIKIFKRPTVYIMAFLLAVVIGASLLLFSPSKKEDTSVQLGPITQTTTISTLFNKFDTDPAYKSAFDQYLNDAKAEILFFESITKNRENLNNTYTALSKSLSRLTASNVTSVETEAFFTNYNKYMTAFEKAHFVSNEIIDNQPAFVKDYYNSNLYDNLLVELTSQRDNLKFLDDQGPEKLVQYLTSSNTSNYSNVVNLFNRSLNVSLNASVEFLKYSINEIAGNLASYKTTVNLGAESNASANTNRRNLLIKIKNFKTSVLNIVDYDKHTFAIINEDEYKSFKSNIDTFIDVVTIQEGSEPKLVDNQQTIAQIDKGSYVQAISSVIDKITLLDCSPNTLTELNKVVAIIEGRREVKYEQINTFNSKNATSKDRNVIANLTDLMSEYKEMQHSLKDYVFYTIQTDTLRNYSTSDIQKFHGDLFYKVYNEYQNNEIIIKNKYYIDNDLYSYELGNTFAFNVNSTNETTMFDFMYYSLKISTIVIVIFSIFMAASIFAAEHDSGTIKLLLIRPFKRHKIVSGKLLATLFFSFIFLTFSTVVSAVIGATMFPTETMTPILAVFNGTTAFKFNPIVLISIFIFFTLLEIIFYVILSSALCTLFKSYVGAVTGSFLAYFATIGMNIGFGKSLWYSYSPFVNLNLFKYFGNGFISNPNSTFGSFFSTPMLGNMDYFISLGVSAGLVALLLAITYVVFKRRDY